MTYYELPSGGAVFSVGSITFPTALLLDEPCSHHVQCFERLCEAICPGSCGCQEANSLDYQESHASVFILAGLMCPLSSRGPQWLLQSRSLMHSWNLRPWRILRSRQMAPRSPLSSSVNSNRNAYDSDVWIMDTQRNTIPVDRSSLHRHVAALVERQQRSGLSRRDGSTQVYVAEQIDKQPRVDECPNERDLLQVVPGSSIHRLSRSG